MSNRNNGLALALSAILVAQPAVAQTEPAVQPAVVEYAPVGPWTVDYAEDSCALFRKFNDGERELWIEFRQIAPDSMARVLIGGSHLVLTEAEPHVTIYPAKMVAYALSSPRYTCICCNRANRQCRATRMK